MNVSRLLVPAGLGITAGIAATAGVVAASASSTDARSMNQRLSIGALALSLTGAGLMFSRGGLAAMPARIGAGLIGAGLTMGVLGKANEMMNAPAPARQMGPVAPHDHDETSGTTHGVDGDVPPPPGVDGQVELERELPGGETERAYGTFG